MPIDALVPKNAPGFLEAGPLPAIAIHVSKLSPRQRLLHSAEKLFAENGIDAVGLRDIAADAGFKNANSLTYHFGSKDNLVREVLLAGATDAENCRRQCLNALHDSGTPMTIRSVIMVLCAPTLKQAVTPSYALLARQMMLTQRDFFFTLLGDDLLLTVVLCHEMMRNLVDSVPPEIMDDRIRLFDLYFNDFVATRHVHIGLGTDEGRWASPMMIEHFLDTAEAVLTTPPSPDSLAATQAFELGRD